MKYKSIKLQPGFSVVELVAVIAGMSALTAIAVPNVIKFVQDGQVDEAKALLNTAAAECGTQLSSGANLSEISPNSLKNASLPGKYSYTGEKTSAGYPSCAQLELKDTDNDVSRLTTLGIIIEPNPLMFNKYASFKHPDSEAGCKQWSPTQCLPGGEIERLKAEAAARAAEDAELRAIEARYQEWLQGVGDGHYTADGKDKWAFQGREVANQQAYIAAQEEHYSKLAMDKFYSWLDGPPKGDGQYTDDGLSKWAVDGVEVADEEAYKLATINSEKNKLEIAASEAAKAGQSMPITISGRTKWVHGGNIYETEQAWNEAKANGSQGGGDNIGSGDGDPINPGNPVRTPEYKPPSNCTKITLPIPGTNPLKFEDRLFCA